jgi:hypothetical protein
MDDPSGAAFLDVLTRAGLPAPDAWYAYALCMLPRPSPETRAMLEERARQADARRFTGAPVTGFGE